MYNNTTGTHHYHFAGLIRLKKRKTSQASFEIRQAGSLSGNDRADNESRAAGRSLANELTKD